MKTSAALLPRSLCSRPFVGNKTYTAPFGFSSALRGGEGGVYMATSACIDIKRNCRDPVISLRCCLLLLLVLYGNTAFAACNNCGGCPKYRTNGRKGSLTVSANVAYASTCDIRANVDGSCNIFCDCDDYKLQLFAGSGTEISGYTQGPSDNMCYSKTWSANGGAL